ncbi:MAG: peptide chain release factor N(5)-glutamine methyltransferase [Balneolia bacterium]|nr:peptide chain release factor N(5)-glutamine methyltransferase [Balneolia bacterium]
MPDAPAPHEWTVLRMLEWATEYFENRKIPSPRLSIEWLLADALGCRRLDLYLKYDRPLSPEELAVVKPLILRRAKHEPLQYITGKTDFFGLEIICRPAALIPRPETEQLVERILEDYPEDQPIRVLDIGTGTGCIPIALKHERSTWDVTGCDISVEALELAKENAAAHELDLHFIEHDLFSPQWVRDPEARFDIIVSNPPYIPNTEKPLIDKEVRDYEPGLALFHENVISVYRAVASFASLHLNSKGRLYLEIHENLGPGILPEITANSLSPELLQDYSGKDRMICAQRTHTNE